MIALLIFGVVGGFILAFLLNALTGEDNSYGTCVGAMAISSIVSRILFVVLAKAMPELGLILIAVASVVPGFLILLCAIKWMLHVDWKPTLIGASAGTIYFVACTVGLAYAFS